MSVTESSGKGGAARENLVRGQDQETGAPPLDRQAEKRSGGGECIYMVN